MTYEEAVQWFVDNIPISMFDNYGDWFEACREEIVNPKMFQEPEFIELMNEAWNEGGTEREERYEGAKEDLSDTEYEEYISEREKEGKEEDNVPVSNVQYSEPLIIRRPPPQQQKLIENKQVVVFITTTGETRQFITKAERKRLKKLVLSS